MNLDDMKMFLAIARSGSLTAAAQALYVSQPALSKRLARLEAELDAPLFERSQGTHRLTLTPAGKMLMPFAEKWDDLQNDLSMLHDLNSHVHFFVDAVATVSEYVLTEVMYEFSRAYPRIETVVNRHHSRECYGAIHDRTADIAFVTQPQYYQNILTAPLFQERMLLLAAADTALEGPQVDVDRLDWGKEIVVQWNSEFMRWRQRHLFCSRHPSVTLPSLPMAIPFLQKSGCWIVAPQTAVDQAMKYQAGLQYRPLADPPPDRTVYWLEEYGRHHESSDDLLALLRKHLQSREGIRWL